MKIGLFSIVSFALAVRPQVADGQAVLRSRDFQVAPSVTMARPNRIVSILADSTHSHARATWIGATAGAVVGGLGTAGWILNALAPNCIRLVSGRDPTYVSSSHCGDRSGIVTTEIVTITAGTVVGALGGAWIARRIAHWRARAQAH